MLLITMLLLSAALAWVALLVIAVGLCSSAARGDRILFAEMSARRPRRASPPHVQGPSSAALSPRRQQSIGMAQVEDRGRDNGRGITGDRDGHAEAPRSPRD